MSSSSSSSSLSVSLPRSIRLVRAAQTRYDDLGVDGFRFTVQADNAVDISVAIFRYIYRSLDPITGDMIAEFDGVCSSIDLQELPISSPLPNASPPFFRTSSLDLVFRSRSQADEAWDAIQTDVHDLLRSLNVQDDLGTSEAVTIE